MLAPSPGLGTKAMHPLPLEVNLPRTKGRRMRRRVAVSAPLLLAALLVVLMLIVLPKNRGTHVNGLEMHSRRLSTTIDVKTVAPMLDIPSSPEKNVVDSPPRCTVSAQPSDLTGCTTKDFTIAVAMIGRDVADFLPYVLRNIERFATLFKRCHVVFVENDSEDKTVPEFKAWAAKAPPSNPYLGKIIVRSLPSLGSHTKKHLNILARARNEYLDILSGPEFNDTDFIVPIDTDMCHPFDIKLHEEILNALIPSHGKEWDAVFPMGVCRRHWWLERSEEPFNDVVPMPDGKYGLLAGNPGCVPTYCDSFALRDHEGRYHGNVDTNYFTKGLVPGNCSYRNGMQYGCRYINGEAVVPVHAAFGGLGIYARHLFLEGSDGSPGCRYASTEQDPCEHVPLGHCIREKRGAKQYIATRFIIDWSGCKGPVHDSHLHRIKCIFEPDRFRFNV